MGNIADPVGKKNKIGMTKVYLYIVYIASILSLDSQN